MLHSTKYLTDACRKSFTLALAVGALSGWQAPDVQAQAAYYEVEPNDTPAQANAISGEGTVMGSMMNGDQDGFMWTVSDNDARKRWTFELHGIPGKLTIAEVVRITYADNGVDVAGRERLMKMGTRDGLTPSVAQDLVFEPGEYLIGIAYAGSGGESSGGMFRPPSANLSFGEDGTPQTSGELAAGTDSAATDTSPGGYRLIMREGSRLAVSKNPGQREAREDAQDMRLGREFATFETAERAWYAFTFSEQDAGQRWDIRVQVPVGRSLEATLYDATGTRLQAERTGPRGQAVFPDLALAAATYYVELVAKQPGFIHAIASEAVGQRVAGEEAEPNGDWAQANRVDLSQPLTGRISKTNEWDYFRFDLDETNADQVLKLSLDTEPAGQALEFCLLASDKTRVQCRRENTPIELPGLVLNQGSWGLSVTRAREGIEYRISLSPQGAIKAGMEAEPNDAIEFASGVPANNRIKGSFVYGEDDFYRFLVVDEPQLWRFQVIGDDITEVAYYDGAGKQVTRIRPDRGQRRMRLENMFLLPGQHYLRVTGRNGGSYTVLARALGPPDPNGEREPNDSSRMQRLAIGQTRTGLLVDSDDSDYYRFYLGNWDHVRLTVQPPADGVIDPYVYWYDETLADAKPGGPGEPVTLSGLFPPGDYHVNLRPTQVSEAEYRISLERLPRYSCPADCEPNGVSQLYLAAPVPPNQVLEGSSGDWGDTDPYELSMAEQPRNLFVRSEAPIKRLMLGRNRFDAEVLSYDAEAGGYATVVPPGGPYQLIVETRGEDYRLQLEFEGAPPVAAELSPLPVDMTLQTAHSAVSAYRRLGQTVAGQLRLHNRGAEAVELELEATTSDYRWNVTLDQDQLTLPGQGSADIALRIDVPPDAWADRPVRISARARTGTGAQAETWAELAVDRDIPPLNPVWGWSVPDSLRGGMNAAWVPFGAELVEPGETAKRYPTLFDGLVFGGARMQCCGVPYGWGDSPRPALTLDLPGDEPLPVAGIALNHFGSPGAYRDVRRATLLLSTDGLQFEEALHIETLPVETEQFFELAAPVSARFARLRFDETFNLRSGANGVTLGEWKVILQPGHDLSAGAGFNIADPVYGGHVVSDSPPRPNSPTSIIEAGDEWHTVRLKDGDIQSYVIGFHHNRAAQVQRIEWVYADEVDPGQKFAKLLIAASTTASIGPWQPLGEVAITADQPVTELALAAPAWARFVKITALRAPEFPRVMAAPAAIRVWERPAGADYRSILSEWGYASPRGFYEQQAGLPGSAEITAAGNTSRGTALALATGQRSAGQVALSKVEHWYRLQVPAGENTLTLNISGDPTVRVRVEAEDDSGNAIAMRKLERLSSPDQHRFEGFVTPGSTVFLRVYEPPRNVVFTWDTSASTLSYLPLIYNSLAAFAGQVIPGQEAVNLVPFGRNVLLKDWLGEPYVLQTILNDYPRRESSSSAELTLKRSAVALAPLAGTKSIVVITDGITVHDGTLWKELQDVQPRIFGVHVGGSEAWNQDVFEDWADVNGGHYTQLLYQGEMEVAFDRAATLMRRPADYTLQVDSEFREAPGPGLLRVLADAGKETGTGAAVELILDASGSMLQRMQGKRRINIAREVLIEAVQQHIPAGTPVALRVFGHREPDACRSDLEIPLAPLDPAQAAKVIGGIQAMNLARTPIADSLAAVESDLKSASGRVAIVLVTDGEETCEGDPAKVIEALQAKGIDVHLNIVGFAIDDADLESRFVEWAALGGGKYLSARDQQGLSSALREALRLPFTVYDLAGSVVAEGVVGGEPIQLEQGYYRIEVAGSPGQVFERVEVIGEQETTVSLK